MNKMNPVVHFELPFEDKQRAADFYAKAFSWQPQMLGPEMGEYVVVTTTEMDPETKFPKEPGRINGGLFKKTQETSQHPTIVVAVDDIHQARKQVEEAGGTISDGQKLGEPDNIPGIGLYYAFTDSEGNRIGMLQPSPIM